MSRIQILPDSVARRIAAGEVIERPMSVVKELVENSLDAGATRITVEIEQGGRKLIAVADDGQGMSPEEVAMAFRPHATSKIHREEDLLAISTLGFRGEALPSVAAVADVEVWTRRRDDAIGSHFRIRGGEPAAVEESGAAAGCRIEVRELFFNTPARRAFLKSPPTEAGHVSQWVARLALAHPEVAFALVQDGREAVTLPPEDLRGRVRRLVGREAEREMRPVSGNGAVGVRGLATHSHYTLPSPRSVWFFVNRRFVRDRMLAHALASAYATLIPHGRHPAAVLHLSVEPEDVDVNVHPAKLEVRFRRSQPVYEAIGRAIRGMLGGGRGEPMAVSDPGATYGRRSGAEPAGRPNEGAEPAALRLADRSDGRAAPEMFAAPGRFALLRAVGQVFDGYLVCEGDDEVVLIDQHAAHERVAFERLRAEWRQGRVETQPLLVPQPVELAAGEAALIAGAASELAGLGLQVEPFGDREVLVRAVPALFSGKDPAILLRALAADLADVEGSRALDEAAEDLLATVACHSVVRVGQRISETETRSLLRAMDEIDLNANCPHGRPVFSVISRTELERRFGRT